MKRKIRFCFILSIIFASSKLLAQNNEQYRLKTELSNQHGVASASVELIYAIKKFEKEIWIPVTYTNILVNPYAGYWYKGKLYKQEVSGLFDLLSTGKNSYPKVKFDIYYDNIKIGTEIISITFKNELSLLTAESIRLKNVSEEQLKRPNYKLVAVAMLSFSNVDWWYKAELLIEKYIKEQEQFAEYAKLKKDADTDFYAKNYTSALSKYEKALSLGHSDSYLANQIKYIKEVLKNNEIDKKKEQFNSLLSKGDKAQHEKKFDEAKKMFQLALNLNFDNFRANARLSTLNDVIERFNMDQKRIGDEKISQLELINLKNIAKKTVDQEEEVIKVLRQKEEEANEQAEEIARAEAKKLKDTDRDLFESSLKEKARQKAKEIAEEEKKEKLLKDKIEESDREAIAGLQVNMSWNSVKYYKAIEKAQVLLKKGTQDVSHTLNLKAEWWDDNIFMKDFREDLNEPRRKDALKNYCQLLREQEDILDNAKYTFMEAIMFTNLNSDEHKYCLAKIKSINSLRNISLARVRHLEKAEEYRQRSYEEAKAWAVINNVKNNSIKAELAYAHLKKQYLKTNSNEYNVTGEANIIKEQYALEKRINDGEAQLKRDNLTTGLIVEGVSSVVTDMSLKPADYGKGAMGLDLFSFFGYNAVPIVTSMDYNKNYILTSDYNVLTTIPLNAGFDWWIRKGNVIDIGVNGEFTFGVTPVLGLSNHFMAYGGGVKMNIGYKAVKLALEAGTHYREGSYNADVDVQNSQNPYFTATGIIHRSEFDYTLDRVGAGFHFTFDDGDRFLRLLSYIEKPSFYEKINLSNPLLTFGLQLSIGDGFTFSSMYSQNYPTAGTAKYPIASNEEQDYFHIYVGKIWTIAVSKKAD